MAFNLSKNRIDKKKQVEGVWCTYGDADDQEAARFLIARDGNPKYQREVRRLTRARIAEVQSDESGETIFRIQQQAASRCILLDWANVTETDPETGEERPVPCTPERIIDAWGSHPDLYIWVTMQSQQTERFLEEARSSTAGNSPALSSG